MPTGSNWAPVGSEPVNALDRRFHDRAARTRNLRGVPVGTRSARVVVTFTDRNPVLGQLQQCLRRQRVLHCRRRTARPTATDAAGVDGRPTRSRVPDLHGEQGLHRHRRQPQRAVSQQPHQHLRRRDELLRADPPQRPELLSDPRRVGLRLQLQLPRELLRPAQPGRQHRGSAHDMGRLYGRRRRLHHVPPTGCPSSPSATSTTTPPASRHTCST